MWAVALNEAFPALHLRYGSPMSDAALRRITSDVPLADLAPLALAVESCACDIRVSGRKNGAMETEAYLAFRNSLGTTQNAVQGGLLSLDWHMQSAYRCASGVWADLPSLPRIEGNVAKAFAAGRQHRGTPAAGQQKTEAEA